MKKFLRNYGWTLLMGAILIIYLSPLFWVLSRR